jgi:hypothetical protein
MSMESFEWDPEKDFVNQAKGPRRNNYIHFIATVPLIISPH